MSRIQFFFQEDGLHIYWNLIKVIAILKKIAILFFGAIWKPECSYSQGTDLWQMNFWVPNMNKIC
jgi:hypothetical protein